MALLAVGRPSLELVSPEVGQKELRKLELLPAATGSAQ
jgi:hypothetical protein